MTRDRTQFTLGSLMLVIATVALLLSVPKDSWFALWRMIPSGLLMLMLVFVGFGIGYGGSKLASRIENRMGKSTTGREKSVD